MPTRGDQFTAALDGRGYRERTAFARDLTDALTSPRGIGEAVLGGLALVHSVHRDVARTEHHLEFAVAPGDPVRISVADVDDGGRRVLAALERRLAGLEVRRAKACDHAGHAERERELARAQLGAGFARAGELADKRRRADELREAMTDLARPATDADPETAIGTEGDRNGSQDTGGEARCA